ncbi:RidA family protein [Desertivirga brevis]|uniref:RidA family protein n=1 Tax=Desertivirga brevis TaxID=2810310 RepID=UPI001A975854|nr:RidA family protein [Pedobacter sp. SYSU D00873]
MKPIFLLAILLWLTARTSAQSHEQRLQQLHLELPPVPEAIGSYVDVVQVGKLLYLSGKGPRKASGEYISGKLGKDLSTEQGYEAASLTAINQIAVLKQKLGDLDKVKRIVKVNGYVNSDNQFYEQPKVINGFSDLLIKVFGESGQHARTALGTNTLPLNMAVEVEMIVELK